MAKRPTSSKSAPSGPSAATATGGGSTRDRNRGPAQKDSSRRAAAIEEDSDEGGGIGAGHDDAAQTHPQGEESGSFDPKAKQSKPMDYVVLEGGTIDDGKVGSKFKICKAGDVVQLTPERAAHFQKHGVPLVDKKTHDERKKKEEQQQHEAAE
jgi:hypothetical protein